MRQRALEMAGAAVEQRPNADTSDERGSRACCRCPNIHLPPTRLIARSTDRAHRGQLFGLSPESQNSRSDGSEFPEPTDLGNQAYQFAPKPSQVVSRKPCAIRNDLTLDGAKSVISKWTQVSSREKNHVNFGIYFRHTAQAK